MLWTKFWVKRARQGRLAARSYVRFYCLVFLLAAASGVRSQEVLPQAIPSQETIHSQSNVVAIPALVKSAQGEVVYGLTASDFVVEDDGVAQPVRMDEVAEGEPVSLVVAIQRGRRADFEFPRMRGLGAMLDPLFETGLGSVAIVEFDSHVQMAQEFTGSSEKIAWTLKSLQPGDGGAAILDAVDYAVKLLEKVPRERQRVLLLISETRDHGSETKLEDAVAEIGRSNTAVYALAFSPSRSNILDTMRGNNLSEMHPSPDLLAPLVMLGQAMKKNMPETVAAMTGGEYEMFATGKHFDARMVDFTNHLHSRYLLSIEPNNPHGGLHQLKVRLKDQGNRVVLARGSYWATGR
jgi:VWFA-related protein